MKKQVLILLFCIPLTLYAQKTKKITKNETRETFYVLKSDKKTRHGEYQKFTYGNGLLIKGNYEYGVRSGIWEFFDFRGQPTSKYDYTKNELVFHRPSEGEKNRKYRIIVNGNHLDAKLSRVPILLGGDALIRSELRYPAIAQMNRISGRTNVIFTVDKIGRASNFQIETPLGYELDEEIIRVFKLLSDLWLPGILNGEPVDVEVIYPIIFRLNN